MNFNGQGTVAIRASGNVSSITDNGTGNYKVNMSTGMTDSSYAAVASGGIGSSEAWLAGVYINSSSEFTILMTGGSNSRVDTSWTMAMALR